MALWDKTSVIYMNWLDPLGKFMAAIKASIWCVQMVVSSGRQACVFVYSKPA